jgi:hypothetical protein
MLTAFPQCRPDQQTGPRAHRASPILQDFSFYACASEDYCDGTGASYKCRTGSTLGQSCASAGPDCVRDMSLVCGTSGKCEDLGFAYDMTCGGTPPFP